MSRLIVDAGQALFGERWQSELARELGVEVRTVQRWAAGTSEARSGVYVDLLRITQERALALDAIADRLRESATPE